MKIFFIFIILSFVKTESLILNKNIRDDGICLSYLTNFGFLNNYQECASLETFCCGSCINRYCCNDSLEILTDQQNCMNNYVDDLNQMSPIKLKKCYSFFDRNGNKIQEFECEEGDFCSGSCTNRYCSNLEYYWLNQDTCRNNEISNLASKEITTQRITFDVFSSKASTVITAGHPFFLLSAALITLSIAFVMMFSVYTKFFSKKRLIQEMEKMNMQLIFNNDKPPAYPGY